MNKNSSNLKTIRMREGKLYGEGCMGWEFEFLFHGNMNKRKKERKQKVSTTGDCSKIQKENFPQKMFIELQIAIFCYSDEAENIGRNV